MTDQRHRGMSSCPECGFREHSDEEVEDLYGRIDRLSAELARYREALEEAIHALEEIYREARGMGGLEEIAATAGGASAAVTAALQPQTAEGDGALPPEVLRVLRDPSIPLPGEETAANLVLQRGCRACLRAEHPYWHHAGTPCPLPATAAPPPRGSGGGTP